MNWNSSSGAELPWQLPGSVPQDEAKTKGMATLIAKSLIGFKISFLSFTECSSASGSGPHLFQLQSHSGLHTLLLSPLVQH